MIHDKLIKILFWDYNKNCTSKLYRRYNQKKNKYVNITEYLNNKYLDSSCIYESVIRICLDIHIKPTCPICNKQLNFIGRINSKGIYSKTCSKSCSTKFTNNFNIHPNESIEKTKQTKLEKYGNLNNFEKAQQTKLTKYGNLNNYQKIKQTKLNKYGDENYNNRDKYKETCLEKYGTTNYVNVDKAKQTCLEKYDVEYISQVEQFKNKAKQTKLDKYGNTNYFTFGSNEYKQYIKDKYGVNNIMQLDSTKEKIKQTCLEKYGVEYVTQTKFVQNKILNTKRQNHTFNVSKPEEQTYLLLKEKYPDVIRQYKDNRYPFACDFYIPSLDLFIECNYHWTHGGKPFENTEEDRQKLQKWKNKNTDFYNLAIYVWSQYDVYKLYIAKENKLNYLMFYNIDKFNDWIKQQKVEH